MSVRADDLASPEDESVPDAVRRCFSWPERTATVPSQGKRVIDVPEPDQDHLGGSDHEAAFVRPPAPEIDYARVVRRADLCRRATRTATVSSGLTGVMLVAYLMTYSRVLLLLTLVAAATLTASVTVRLRLATAPIPYLRT